MRGQRKQRKPRGNVVQSVVVNVGQRQGSRPRKTVNPTPSASSMALLMLAKSLGNQPSQFATTALNYQQKAIADAQIQNLTQQLNQQQTQLMMNQNEIMKLQQRASTTPDPAMLSALTAKQQQLQAQDQATIANVNNQRKMLEIESAKKKVIDDDINASRISNPNLTPLMNEILMASQKRLERLEESGVKKFINPVERGKLMRGEIPSMPPPTPGSAFAPPPPPPPPPPPSSPLAPSPSITEVEEMATETASIPVVSQTILKNIQSMLEKSIEYDEPVSQKDWYKTKETYITRGFEKHLGETPFSSRYNKNTANAELEKALAIMSKYKK